MQTRRKSSSDIRAYGLRNPVAVISNGINLPVDEEDREKVEGRTSGVGPSSKVLLFLARVHPKKGLAELIEGWRISPARRNGWMLEIASWDDGKHEAQLRAHCERLGLGSSVSWVGPQYGMDLAAAYKRASAFILPSFSEGLPMAVLAAWAYGKPVLMTPHCNLPEGFAAQAALKIDPDPDSIAEGITRIHGNAGRRTCRNGTPRTTSRRGKIHMAEGSRRHEGRLRLGSWQQTEARVRCRLERVASTSVSGRLRNVRSM